MPKAIHVSCLFSIRSLSLWLLLASWFLGSSYAQDKYAYAYVCAKGKIHFFSATSLEDIEATSHEALCVFNTNSKKIYAKMRQVSFLFKDKLMQDRFNENYMESERFPFDILDMTLVDELDFTRDGSYELTLKRTLYLYGTKKERETKGKIIIMNGQPVQASSEFMVNLADYNIEIPSILAQILMKT